MDGSASCVRLRAEPTQYSDWMAMGWEDRHYSRGEKGTTPVRDMFRRLGEFFNQSIPLGSYLGIRVRLHILFLVFVLGELIFVMMQDVPLNVARWQIMGWTLRWMFLLFISVVAHEFGHCLACRSVGGTADDILMWPLGGLAYCAAPRRPWAEFVTVIWGPMVNFLIAGVCYSLLKTVWADLSTVTLNPKYMWAQEGGFPVINEGIPGLLADLFVVNYVLLLFNLLLVFYPFDGGRLIQIALWNLVGYSRSMLLATRVGMVGAVLVALYAIAVGTYFLILIAIFGFYACYQQGMMLRYGEEEESFEYDVGMYGGSQAQEQPSPLAKWKAQRQEMRRKREADRRVEAERDLDRILAKIKAEGMASLTSREKRSLQRATKDRQRNG